MKRPVAKSVLKRPAARPQPKSQTKLGRPKKSSGNDYKIVIAAEKPGLSRQAFKEELNKWAAEQDIAISSCVVL